MMQALDKDLRSGLEKTVKAARTVAETAAHAAVDQLGLMREANCNFLAFGIEAGTQKVMDRLKKKQTPAQVEQAVSQAKRHGIERVHGFFVVGSPDETAADILASFRFAARLELDTFGFNRLCAYRGTPLWQEYVDRGIIDDERDWQKWFKCTDIDPTALSGPEVNRLRMKGYARLFASRLCRRPIKTLHLLRTFGRHMKVTDLLRLLASPFRRRHLTHQPDLPARMADALLEPPQLGKNSSGQSGFPVAHPPRQDNDSSGADEVILPGKAKSGA